MSPDLRTKWPSCPSFSFLPTSLSSPSFPKAVRLLGSGELLASHSSLLRSAPYLPGPCCCQHRPLLFLLWHCRCLAPSSPSSPSYSSRLFSTLLRRWWLRQVQPRGFPYLVVCHLAPRGQSGGVTSSHAGKIFRIYHQICTAFKIYHQIRATFRIRHIGVRIFFIPCHSVPQRYSHRRHPAPGAADVSSSPRALACGTPSSVLRRPPSRAPRSHPSARRRPHRHLPSAWPSSSPTISRPVVVLTNSSSTLSYVAASACSPAPPQSRLSRFSFLTQYSGNIRSYESKTTIFSLFFWYFERRNHANIAARRT